MPFFKEIMCAIIIFFYQFDTIHQTKLKPNFDRQCVVNVYFHCFIINSRALITKLIGQYVYPYQMVGAILFDYFGSKFLGIFR